MGENIRVDLKRARIRFSTLPIGLIEISYMQLFCNINDFLSYYLLYIFVFSIALLYAASVALSLMNYGSWFESFSIFQSLRNPFLKPDHHYYNMDYYWLLRISHTVLFFIFVLLLILLVSSPGLDAC
jgi:hypothetical protein